ncbi:Zn(2)-Cys(6) binuclear cluster domain-containing protein [Metschnikowia aff. pulcherrima]|uniref:Zn(2)-Cys(6) binuclear cluster domain-containing protein n=1 Tax=Metschnikowia aff. pulcherrima TaxID=2163413 RepID=A0A4P6XK74_9ASCO|nr:Zn(2)-Cys(6) binuclear cluster domain-containing protein [Metschnikowia aff. pulcherrima]
MTKDPKAPRRKKHKNSKLGCATCKRRRVKCQETLPECINCVKHGARCEYLDYSERQLEDFRKAKLENETKAVSMRRSPTENSAPSLESLSLGSTSRGLTLSKEHEHNASRSIVDGRSALADVFGRPPLRGSGYNPGNFLYPGVPLSALSHGEDLPWRSPLSPVDNEYFQANLADTQYGNTISSEIALGNERPMYESRDHSLDLVPIMYSSDVRQGFDNLLTEQDQQIIYPVYSFRKSVESQWSYNSSTSMPPFQSDDAEGNLDVTLPGNMDIGGGENSGEGKGFPRMLPHAQTSSLTFKILEQEDMDFEARLLLYIVNLGPLISQGKAELQQIRGLYHAWLGHFICKAFDLSIMFLCLTNLTTNYLITNVFRGRQTHDLDSNEQVNLLRKTLLMHLIQHYAAVIKSLRCLLNKNSDPHLAASVSYLLSIMSIYDPEATLDSTVCFRDGMFSVLSYTLQLSKNNGHAPPPFVPVHMQLAANVVRTVYFPAYDPSFLDEYEVMLRRLGVTINSIKPSEILNLPTFKFIVEVYDDLWTFCQESLKVHIPAVNQNLDNIPFQLDVLFTMFRKWANLGPSRLLTVRKSTDPLEKVLNLFFRLFRKAVYVVLPQVRFCFLRDFDSPLMLDVFPNSCDASVLSSLDSPENLCLVPDAYSRVLGELKVLSAYAIRVISFMNMRIAILYKNLVYSEKVRRLYPINNIVDWKDSISDIQATRKEFQERIGLKETHIKSFNQTYISKVHYPRIVEPGSCETSPDEPDGEQSSPVEILSLNPYGLLEKDALPSLG